MAAMEPEDGEKGYRVRDRRRFTETGDLREESAADAGSPDEPPAKSAAKDDARREPGPATEDPQAEEPITLGGFLVSLSTQALVLLGEIPSPITGKSETDLSGVREIIDLIAMLQEKTRGNVDPAEGQLFDKILYDLRMRYVEKVRA